MYLARKLYLGALWVLSIQQKFRFEISEIQLAQWSCTFRLHRPDPSHRAFGYCSCKQNTKERYREKQFGQMEKGHFGPTDRDNGTSQSASPSKLVSNILVGPNWNGLFHLMYQPKFPEFELKGKRPVFPSPTEDWTAILRVLQATWRSSRLQCKGSTFISELFQDREYWSGPGNRAGNLPLSSQALYRLS